MKRYIIHILRTLGIGVIIILISFSCKIKAEKESETNNAVSPKEELLNQLHLIKDQHILIGHQDDLAYGVHWKYEKGRSDVKEVAGSFPALVGWDIGGIGLGLNSNLDSVPFNKMKELILFAHEQGIINTISWHAFNPFTQEGSWTDLKKADTVVSNILPGGAKHADYLRSLDLVSSFFHDLRTPKGDLIPIIFRPFHENTGNWFWWGEVHCSAKEYIELFQFTHDYLVKKQGLNNLIFAYSPDRHFTSKEMYLERFPGDDYVDIIGYDDYYSFKIGDISGIKKRLEIITGLADEKGKIAAFTETGLEGLKDEKPFTEILLPVLHHNEKTKRIAYMMFWRNANTKHFYMPYEGHSSSNDFIEFINLESILLNDGFQKLKNE